MGSAILAACARRGTRAIGLEQFGPAHELGSSSGRSRLIRKAYFEDPAYVPLLLRAYDLWRELERESGEDLLTITGLLMVGPENSEIVTGAQRAARAHALALEVLGHKQLRARHPALRFLPNEIGVFEPDGGVLVPERAVEAQLRGAIRAGADVRFGAVVRRWEPADDGFEVLLEDDTRISARTLVLAMGPWFADALGVPLRIQRNVQAWFTPASAAYSAGRVPPFLLERDHFPAPLYGFPDFGDGVKAAFHAHGAFSTPNELDRTIDPVRDVAPIAAAMEEWMPGSATAYHSAKVCPYSLTPDGHFVVDRHPAHHDVVLCGGFSGHGFKFAPVIGEIAADLALDGGTAHEIGFLSAGRFARGADLD